MENYTPKGLLLICILFLTFKVSSQYCDIRVAKEPVIKSIQLDANNITQTSQSVFQKWDNLIFGLPNDGKDLSIKFKNHGFSTILKFSDFGFNLPAGSKVTGITVMMNGRRSGSGFVNDHIVRLISRDSVSVNQSGKGYTKANIFSKQPNNKSWKYGNFDDSWGTSKWNAELFNDPSFGLEFQVLSINNKEVEAFISDVKIELRYIELPTFCKTDCFPIYTDREPGVFSYKWSYPQTFELISKFESSNILDFKVMKVTPGIYKICVDALDINGIKLGTCCRDIRVIDCTPSTIGNFVWNDINYNGLQDPGEPGIGGVKLTLKNNLGQVISTVTSSPNGEYTFTNVNAGSYSISVEIPDNFLKTKNIDNRPDLNSDFALIGNSTKNFIVDFGQQIKNIDFGLVKKLSLGDFVWEDINLNGIQDTGEPGLTNIKVIVLDSLNNIVDSTRTNAQGIYRFILPASRYKIKVEISDVYLATVTNSSNISKNSDIVDDYTTPLFNYENTSINLDLDAGFFRLGSIGDLVWEDINDDGIFNNNEVGSEGIKIYLLNDVNLIIDSTITNQFGNYKFGNLLPGSYSLRVILPRGTIPTKFNVGGSGSLLEQKGDLFVTPKITIKSGEFRNDVDLGYSKQKGKISGIVWNDEMPDGIYSVGEELVPGILVSLLNENQEILETTFTDDFGAYCFDTLEQNKYIVSFAIDDDLQFTYPEVGLESVDSDVLNSSGIGYTEVIFLPAGDTIKNIFAGVVRRSVIGDFVFNDKNYNGVQDPGEEGIPNVLIELYDTSGNLIDQTTSNEDGAYLFQKILAGSYRLKAYAPPGFLFTKLNQGSDDLDNDFNEFGSSPFILNIGNNILNIDVGFVKSISVGDLVWLDKNANGIRDSNEEGLEGVGIEIYDENNQQIGIQFTNPDGKYLFSNLPASRYYFKIWPQDNYKISPILQGSDKNKDSDFDPNSRLTNLLFINNDDFTIDAGLYLNGCIGQYVWIDDNEDGLIGFDEEALSIEVNLLDISGNIIAKTFSNSDGLYSICDIKPGQYLLQFKAPRYLLPTIKGGNSILNTNSISDTITICSGDKNLDLNAGFVYRPVSKICGIAWDDKNVNGALDLEENGLKDIRVALFRENSTFVIETLTDENGNYCFSELDSGYYFVRFYIDDTKLFTASNIVSDDIDSDGIGLIDSSQTDIIYLDLENDISNIYIGIINRSKIGDYIWFDQDKDGLQSPSEIGIPNVEVSLLDENMSLIKTTISDKVGYYEFANLLPGNYFVSFQTNPNFEFTLKGVSTDKGSSVNPDGKSDLITILPNQDNLNIDAGYIIKGGSISGIVWLDVDKDSIRSATDIPLSLDVFLYNEQGILIQQTVSNRIGIYSFNSLPDGKYYVLFGISEFLVQLPLSQFSDITNEFGTGSTSLIELKNNNSVIGIDAGFINIKSSISGQVFIDKNINNLIDVSDSLLSEIKVYLLDTNNTIIDSAFTDNQGLYLFDSLYEGKYLVNVILNDTDYLFIIPSDSLFGSKFSSNGFSDTINLSSCQNIKNINAGLTTYGSICGSTFFDENENGINDDINPLPVDLVVCIINDKNQILRIDTTKNGFYRFDKVQVGKYRIKAIRPLYYLFTEADVNSNSQDDIDSDLKLEGPLGGLSEVFNLETKEKEDIDIGMFYSIPSNSSISGNVWEEFDIDGIRNSDEVKVPGIILVLYDDNLQEIERDTSDSEGSYSFNNLIEGYYYIKALLPDSLTTTYYQVGNDKSIDNDFTNIFIEDATNVFYLGINSDSTNLDLGLTKEVRIGDYVWNDLNFNGQQDIDEEGVSGITVQLFDENQNLIKSTVTNFKGFYEFRNLVNGKYNIRFIIPSGFSHTQRFVGSTSSDSNIDDKGFVGLNEYSQFINHSIDAGIVKNGSIGDRIWIDFNANGIQDLGEPGKDSVVVELYNESNELVASTISRVNTSTNSPGFYQFTNLRPGNYYIKVNIISSFLATEQNNGDENQDSDIDKSGRTSIFTLAPGQAITNVDAGIYSPGCIGDRVWIDTNKNGIQNSGEVGLEGVKVELYKSNGTLVSSTTTNESGNYLFNKLSQGVYYLKFILPPGYKFTESNAGDDEALDSDALETGLTALLSLAHAVKYFDMDAGVYLGTQINELIVEEGEYNSEIDLESVNIYPNPALDAIQLNIPFDKAKITIMTKHGQILDIIEEYNRGEVYYLKKFDPGQYLYKVEAQGKSITKKFIRVN